MSLYLLFDVGNTRLKWAAVESTHIRSTKKIVGLLWIYQQ